MVKASHSRWLVTAALLCLALPAPMRAAGVTFGEIEITVLPQARGPSWHGYYEYVFRVENHSTEHAHTVSVSLPFEERRYNPADTLRDLRRTVQVGANETVRISLLQPDYPPIEGLNSMAVSIDGQRQDREVTVMVNNTQHRRATFYGRGGSASMGSTMSEPLVLVSKRIRAEELPRGKMPAFGGAAKLPGVPPGRGVVPPGMVRPGGATPRPSGLPPPQPWMAPRGGAAPPPLKTGFPASGIQFENAQEVETWSADWLAYSRYDGIILRREDLAVLSAVVRTAMWQYVETGGTLLVVGPAKLDGLSAVAQRTKDKAGWTIVRAGFGQCFVSPDADYHKWDQQHFNMLSSAWLGMVQSWQGERSTRSADKEFPVVSDLGVPAKTLFTIMFLFAVTIGPANFLVLARLKRRIWLLWTVPAISLFTCLAVLFFMLLSEGWTGQVRTETFTLLDQTTHRATTMGWTGVYTPWTPSDGLHFSYQTEVIAQRMEESWRSRSRACTLDWSRDQHLASGWVEARVPTLFKVRKSEMQRERVDLKQQADGRWSLVNALRAPISRIRYADGMGRIHTATNIAMGAKVLLEPTNEEIQVQPAEYARSVLLSNNWMASMTMFAKEGQRRLRANTYLAELDGSPFLEDALLQARSVGSHALVMGFCPPSGSEP